MRCLFAFSMASVMSLSLYAQRMTDAVSHSPYILAVDEYVPAPGQFVNILPTYEEGDDAAAMAERCTQAIAGDNRGMVSLGGWGGYITFHFDHSIANIAGQRDFFIRGNALQNYSNGNETGGSSEPGVVMVSKDVNGNGLPDDAWYEISGSADVDSVGRVDYGYTVTYRRNDMQDIPWTDNRGGTGVITRLDQYHPQEYYPLWVAGDELTFSGTLLPGNLFRRVQVVQGTEYVDYVLMALRYGYADNQPNAKKEACSIDIGWAVDERRQPAELDFIDFVRVYTGVNQVVGLLGETSTEVMGAEDLHLDASLEAIRQATGVVSVEDDTHAEVRGIYTTGGISLAQPSRGVNIIRMTDGRVRKISR